VYIRPNALFPVLPFSFQGMLTQLKTLARAIGEAKSVVTTELGPITPPPLDEVRGSAALPYFDRLSSLPDVESLAGAAREPPVVLPVKLSSVPDTVETFSDVSNALQQATVLCTLLANQRGLVQNSYALRAALITHLFIRVIPLPLPPSNTGRALRCFWARKDRKISHDTQVRSLSIY